MDGVDLISSIVDCLCVIYIVLPTIANIYFFYYEYLVIATIFYLILRIFSYIYPSLIVIYYFFLLLHMFLLHYC